MRGLVRYLPGLLFLALAFTPAVTPLASTAPSPPVCPDAPHRMLSDTVIAFGLIPVAILVFVVIALVGMRGLSRTGREKSSGSSS